ADSVVDNVIITIPGPRDRSSKEISQKMLAQIIQSRMEEIMEFVAAEIKNSGFEDKLVAGIVITGGGAQLENMKELAEYVTGVDTRIGLPIEHLASGMIDEVNFPMYATGTGLVIMGLESTDYIQRPSLDQKMELKQQVSGTPHLQPHSQVPHTQPEAEKPRISFIERVKSWFENTLSNTGDFIE
ncbi:MAG: cell division FtsA domain-containing protein, partial [Bacteroidia bacterium]